MSDEMRSKMRKIAQEIKKHAERDDCYECKQLLKTTLISAFLEQTEVSLVK